MQRIGIVGGGIVGLTLAHALVRSGRTEVVVLEKESELALHQSGRNSGVVHAGVYYRPGSLKAQLCRRGAGLLREFCAAEGLPFEEVGKVVVASDGAEAERLAEIEVRARANGVPNLRRCSAAELAELEPSVTGVAALHSPTTAITDFAAVARRVGQLVADAGHEVRTAAHVVSVLPDGPSAVVEGESGSERFDHVIVCAGLGTTGIVHRSRPTFDRGPVAVPFRGEYLRLRPSARALVRGLVYPVPDPRYPFLGVHFTPRVDGEVLIGPNAVLATAMEGYLRRDVVAGDLVGFVGSAAFWKMAARNWRAGAYEVAGSISRRRFVERARRYVPSLSDGDVEPAPAGVRAQAVGSDGALLDDFVIERRGAVTLVRNAPSPAATSSMAIAEHLLGSLEL